MEPRLTRTASGSLVNNSTTPLRSVLRRLKQDSASAVEVVAHRNRAIRGYGGVPEIEVRLEEGSVREATDVEVLGALSRYGNDVEKTVAELQRRRADEVEAARAMLAARAGSAAPPRSTARSA